ncbi:uncharacterized protein [Mytilus edulis]|uniref:uncharacterized protein n=1 Tax=Mytilus edulis TaxID=6550 RepID=UPI0039F030B4
MFLQHHLPIICLVLSGQICVVSSLCSSKLENSLFDDLIGMMLKLKGSGHGGQGNTSTQKNIPAFTAYRNSIQSLSSKAIVKFDKLWTNTMNAYDVTTGVFTAPLNLLEFRVHNGFQLPTGLSLVPKMSLLEIKYLNCYNTSKTLNWFEIHFSCFMV